MANAGDRLANQTKFSNAAAAAGRGAGRLNIGAQLPKNQLTFAPQAAHTPKSP